MTQQDKELLLKDLCPRLPYGVKCHIEDNEMGDIDKELTPIEVYALMLGTTVNIKPYLRSMSSMTEKEYKEYDKALELDCNISANVLKTNLKAKKRVLVATWYNGTDWLNAHHFDYRGLISKGLALEALEGMYKTE